MTAPKSQGSAHQGVTPAAAEAGDGLAAGRLWKQLAQDLGGRSWGLLQHPALQAANTPPSFLRATLPAGKIDGNAEGLASRPSER